MQKPKQKCEWCGAKYPAPTFGRCRAQIPVIWANGTTSMAACGGPLSLPPVEAQGTRCPECQARLYGRCPYCD